MNEEIERKIFERAFALYEKIKDVANDEEINSIIVAMAFMVKALEIGNIPDGQNPEGRTVTVVNMLALLNQVALDPRIQPQRRTH